MRFSFLPLLLLVACDTYASSIATYRLTVVNNWTQSNYPANYPGDDAHFSWLGGGTHSRNTSFWDVGSIASPGFKRMAETGVTTQLVEEIESAGGEGLEWRHWFCTPASSNGNCGSLTVDFTISSDKPALTLTSMLGPSPDWFVGTSGLDMMPNGAWRANHIFPLALYDGGTEEGLTPTMTNPASNPFQPIFLLQYDAASGTYVESNTPMIVGEFQFSLINVSQVPLPATAYFFASALTAVILARRKRATTSRYH